MKDLTPKMLAGLRTAANGSGGVAGSGWYYASSLGGIANCRALNRRGLLRIKDMIMAGGLYTITPAGRSLLKGERPAQDEATEGKGR